MSANNTSLPPGRPEGVPSGNGKYIVVVLLLLAVVGAVVFWKACYKPPEPVTVITPSASVSTRPPPTDDYIPPPAPTADAGVDAGQKTTIVHMTNPCDVKCTGATTPDLEAALAQRAQQSKRRCYYPALTSDTTLKGRASISVKVGSNGSACSVAVSSNELANPAVAECTASSYRSGGFPAPKGGCVQVTVPINYVPGT